MFKMNSCSPLLPAEWAPQCEGQQTGARWISELRIIQMMEERSGFEVWCGRLTILSLTSQNRKKEEKNPYKVTKSQTRNLKEKEKKQTIHFLLQFHNFKFEHRKNTIPFAKIF